MKRNEQTPDWWCRKLTVRDDALRYLYKHLRDAKIAYGRAEGRPGVKPEELKNLQRKIDVLDWVIPLVIKEDDNETD